MKINWFKNILNLIISKSFLGSVAFAFALWFYTTLNSEFVTIVKIPFSVILPAHKALETQLPSIISVEVRGTGWKLFNLLFFNSAARCQLDLSLEKLSNISFQAHRNDIIKSLQYMSNVEALDVWPQNLDIETGSIGEFSVLVEPDIKIIPRDGFTLVGKISVKPDLINIKGNLKIVSNINSWKTQKTEIYDSYLPVSQIVPLSDSLKNVVELSHSQVRVIADNLFANCGRHSFFTHCNLIC